MYDVYGKVGDEFDRVVVKAGASLPSNLDPSEWTKLGSPQMAKPDIDADIARQGFSKYRTNIKFTENETIGAPPSSRAG